MFYYIHKKEQETLVSTTSDSASIVQREFATLVGQVYEQKLKDSRKRKPKPKMVDGVLEEVKTNNTVYIQLTRSTEEEEIPLVKISFEEDLKPAVNTDMSELVSYFFTIQAARSSASALEEGQFSIYYQTMLEDLLEYLVSSIAVNIGCDLIIEDEEKKKYTTTLKKLFASIDFNSARDTNNLNIFLNKVYWFSIMLAGYYGLKANYSGYNL